MARRQDADDPAAKTYRDLVAPLAFPMNMCAPPGGAADLVVGVRRPQDRAVVLGDGA
ncbi:MAG: hypothetical protein V3R84_04760 [Acidimicrobiia bacterium]